MATKRTSRLKGTCAITGCNGFIGQSLSVYLEESGWSVVRLSREKSSSKNNSESFIPFNLGDTLRPEMMHNIDALIHCAYDYSHYRWSDVKRVNIDGTEELFRSAAKGGIRKILYLSSMSAFPGTRSNYGKAKLKCESLTKQYDGISVRAGLVFSSERNNGVIASIERIVSRFPIVPLFSPDKKLYLCNLNDLCRFLDMLLLEEKSNHCITVANSKPVTLLNVVQGFQHKQQRFAPVVIVPWRAAWLLLRMLEVCGICTPFRSDALLGFVFQNDDPDFSSLEKYSISMRNNLIEG